MGLRLQPLPKMPRASLVFGLVWGLPFKHLCLDTSQNFILTVKLTASPPLLHPNPAPSTFSILHKNLECEAETCCSSCTCPSSSLSHIWLVLSPKYSACWIPSLICLSLPLGHCQFSSGSYQFLTWMTVMTSWPGSLSAALLPALVCIATKVILLYPHFYQLTPGLNTFSGSSIILKTNSQQVFKAFGNCLLPPIQCVPPRPTPFVISILRTGSQPVGTFLQLLKCFMLSQPLLGKFSLCLEHPSTPLPFHFHVFNRELCLSF